MKVYPSTRYHPEKGWKLVRTEDEDAALVGWFESPAEYGVETCPGLTPDPVIAKAAEKLLKKESKPSPSVKRVKS